MLHILSEILYLFELTSSIINLSKFNSLYLSSIQINRFIISSLIFIVNFSKCEISISKTFLELNITRHENDFISINQKNYLNRIFTHFNMTKTISVIISFNSLIYLLKVTQFDKHVNEKLYQELIESFNHLTIFSHSDIFNAISHFIQDFSEIYMKVAYYILRYLKILAIFVLCMNTQELRILEYVDAN